MINSWALPVRLQSPFGYEAGPLTPALEVDEPAVAIEVGAIKLSEAGVRLSLHLALGFDAEFFHAFKHISHAVVVTIEEPDTRRFAAVRLIDGGMQYLHPIWPNLAHYDWDAEPSIVFSTLARSVSIEVAATPGPTHTGLWLQASVLRYHSKRVHVSLRTRS